MFTPPSHRHSTHARTHARTHIKFNLIHCSQYVTEICCPKTVTLIANCSTAMAQMTSANDEMKSLLAETNAQLAKVNAKNWKMATTLSSTCSTLDKLLTGVRLVKCCGCIRVSRSCVRRYISVWPTQLCTVTESPRAITCFVYVRFKPCFSQLGPKSPPTKVFFL